MQDAKIEIDQVQGDRRLEYKHKCFLKQRQQYGVAVKSTLEQIQCVDNRQVHCTDRVEGRRERVYFVRKSQDPRLSASSAS